MQTSNQEPRADLYVPAYRKDRLEADGKLIDTTVVILLAIAVLALLIYLTVLFTI